MNVYCMARWSAGKSLPDAAEQDGVVLLQAPAHCSMGATARARVSARAVGATSARAQKLSSRPSRESSPATPLTPRTSTVRFSGSGSRA